MKRVLILALLLGLAACKQETAQDTSPVELTAETLGHFCQMNLLEHPGPKAQVHLEGLPGMPIFFSQVRDAIAYQRLPEQSHTILAMQVNDMGAANATWDNPGKGNWIDANEAYYVIGSTQPGGMGAPETIPFASQAAAASIAASNGGQVVRLTEIPDDMVLAPVAADGTTSSPSDSKDESDFEQRLRALAQPGKG
ncbi:nitrous oxide reductase accessory protein NosL [Paracoccus litorisediminis]|jgi:copper chaperone NosL|uniref:Copper resistance protein CopZ n=1 Tax=Paracoccus litorisediminis TaxID=2006130 RepID=A0A844HW22_9RHOB|nr:nitrous oxide reductase accessory protein NosL [Paracoccus litorisediminis]MTH61721.1 copper resistance protein CopZ [Paracoccus litorisediminis]